MHVAGICGISCYSQQVSVFCHEFIACTGYSVDVTVFAGGASKGSHQQTAQGGGSMCTDTEAVTQVGTIHWQ